MDLYSNLVFLHILCLVFWLGTDIGVLVLSKFAQKSIYTVEQRLLLLKVAMILDMFPRTFMVIAFATGFHLAIKSGFAHLDSSLIIVVWVFCTIWLTLVLVSFFKDQQPAGVTARKFEKVVQFSLIAGLVLLGLISIFSEGPVVPTWLTIKILLFAAILAVVPLLERAFMPALLGFISLEAEGSSAKIEKQINQGINRTVFWVLMIYAAVIIISYLGVTKPW